MTVSSAHRNTNNEHKSAAIFENWAYYVSASSKQVYVQSKVTAVSICRSEMLRLTIFEYFQDRLTGTTAIGAYS